MSILLWRSVFWIHLWISNVKRLSHILLDGARRRRSVNGLEGGLLACPSARTSTSSTRWAQVNLMPCLAWYGAKPCTSMCDPRDQQVLGSHIRRVLENHDIRTLALRSPAWPVRYAFRFSILLRYRSIWGDGACFFAIFLARRVRTDKRRVEGVGASGGHPGSSAREWRSLHVDRPIDV
jgi:hypothetical protein